ncbi:MAG: ORF6N domain-containing protein [Prevotella sp.]|nr:ORF6N domain-containing protein [Prevotella sp.]
MEALTSIHHKIRNMERFEGEDFMFQLTREEVANDLTSQIVISSWGGTRKLPFAFTELGVAMLSSVLHSRIAIDWIHTSQKVMEQWRN